MLRLLLSREGGARHFVTGHSIAPTVIGAVGSLIDSTQRDSPPTMLLILGLLLVPTLLSLLVIEQIWRWDDAYPVIRSHWRPVENAIKLGTVRINDETSQPEQVDAAKLCVIFETI